MFIISLLISIGLYQQAKAVCDPLASPCPSPCVSIQFNCVSLNCQSFTGKLGDSNTNPFSGNISYVDGTVDLLVTITYTDPNFSDTTIKGIVTGENPESCLSLSLWRYTNKDFLEKELSEYKINYTDDGSAKRNYQFTVPSKDFVKQLQLSDDGTSYNFQGYYSYEFSIGNSLQSVLLFDFVASIKRTSTADINTNFGSLSQKASLPCGGSCEISAASKIQFCSDEACTTPSDTYSLYLNDQVWIKQSLTTVGTQGYYLTDAKIYYTGDKLFKAATILQKKINQTGYAMYLIKITIAWKPVYISVTSSLSSTAGARLLQTNKGSTSATSNEIECVKDKDTQECIKCDQTCDVDNSESEPSDGCPTDCDFAQIISYLMILAMIFIQ